MKKYIKKVAKVMEIVVEQVLILTCFQLQVGGLCFGVPSSTCVLHMLLSNLLRLFKYIWAGPSDWLTHVIWWQANVGGDKWLSFTTGVSVYLL